MPSYILTYDLRKEPSTHDYKPLYTALEAAGAHRTMASVWLLASNKTASQVVDWLKGYTDGNDRLWVTRLRKGEYHYLNAIVGTNDWINRNPPQ